MCTIKVPVLVKATVRKKYMFVGKIAPAYFITLGDGHSLGDHRRLNPTLDVKVSRR
jgi:hypothetical protein